MRNLAAVSEFGTPLTLGGGERLSAWGGGSERIFRGMDSTTYAQAT